MNGVLEGEGGAARAGGVVGVTIGAAGFQLECGRAACGINEHDFIEGHGDVNDIANAVAAVRSCGVDLS